MRELKQVVDRIQEIKLEDKFAKKRSILVVKLNKSLKQLVIGYYDEKIRFFKPCDNPRTELLATTNCVIS